MIKLIPMTENEFKAYLDEDIARYAETNVQAGYWDESDALEKSRQVHEQLLPEGLATKNQHLFSIIDDSSGQYLGMIWLEIKPEGRNPSAFIYDFVINKEFRGQGIGKQALLAAENVLRSLGVKTISLHVFNDNTAAKKLYEKVGFEITSYNMRKKL
ncbi:MAG: GNAT family N-acetyltransferase [Chloroflexi bacterium]|nr:GNAT family N-acetyltransferase [Chloroflexota bacterium]